MPGRSMRWRTRSPVYESLIDDDLSPRILHSSGTIFSRPSYDIVFCMSFLHRGEEADLCEDTEVKKDFVRWYKIKIYPDGPLQDERELLEIRPSWEGLLPHGSSFVAPDLGGCIFCLGGEMRSDSIPFFVPNIYRFDPFRPDMGWIHTHDMCFPRLRPQGVFLHDSLFIISGDLPARFGQGMEVSARFGQSLELYNPHVDVNRLLPGLPVTLGSHFICAALENQDGILVAPRSVAGGAFMDSKATFWVLYRARYWEFRGERKIHPKCPLDRGKALTVGNTLYWITDDYFLLAYLYDHDMWLLGHLSCLGLSIFGYNEWYPILLHLQDQRFCMVQAAPGNVVHCVLLDVYHKPMQKRLKISVVSVKKYKTEKISCIRHCFLRGKSI